MPETLAGKLVVGISSRALFDLEAEDQLFRDEGRCAFVEYQKERAREFLLRGAAFPLAKNLLALKHPSSGDSLVEVMLLSKNDPAAGLRVLRSLKQYKLPISRVAMTGGRSPLDYVQAYEVDLFLSADARDVADALQADHAAARIYTNGLRAAPHGSPGEVRIAFDGDAVIFGDQAETVYQTEGLESFRAHEDERADEPLPAGPFKRFLGAINGLQETFGEGGPIRTMLITSRGADTLERPLNTLATWGVSVDEMFATNGLDKTPVLRDYLNHMTHPVDRASECYSQEIMA